MRWKYVPVAAIALALLSCVPVAAQEDCVGCHENQTPGIVEQYEESRHYGVDVGCLDCHGAEDGDPAAENHNGYVVSLLVTPRDCGECHPDALRQFRDSMHDEAGLYSSSAMAPGNETVAGDGVAMGENSNVLTHFSEVSAESGCLECHGNRLTVLNDENPEAPEDDVEIENYPNSGMGRFNPDGSVGFCGACHPQHEFSLAQARRPQSCSECHMGPDHPQYEIYEESKHSTMYEHGEEEFNLSVDPEKLGADDVRAPTCAICHMSGLGKADTTHDVSSRLYWELEPVYSYPTDMKYEAGSEGFDIDDGIGNRVEEMYGLENGSLDTVPTGAPDPFAIARSSVPGLYEDYVGEGRWWSDVGEDTNRADSFSGASSRAASQKREGMKEVCGECHASTKVDGEFAKSDLVPHLYDAVYSAAKQKYYDPIANHAPKAEEYDRSVADMVEFEMWHHEGRRWRMGAFMQGQDYEHWHGAYDVVKDVVELADLKAEMTEETPIEGETPGAPGPTAAAALSALVGAFLLLRRNR